MAEAFESFLRQAYPAELRELVILDDAGQYDPAASDHLPGVKLITTRHRFRTLGEKRNASAALASPDCDAYAVWDDDDIYLPWHLEAMVAVFHAGIPWSRPAEVWVDWRTHLERKPTGGLFHGSWASPGKRSCPSRAIRPCNPARIRPWPAASSVPAFASPRPMAHPPTSTAGTRIPAPGTSRPSGKTATSVAARNPSSTPTVSPPVGLAIGQPWSPPQGDCPGRRHRRPIPGLGPPARRPGSSGLAQCSPLCPAVGLRTGAAFVEHGLTGYLVDRLPPGRQCVANENDERALAAYLDALSQAQSPDRRSICAAEAEQFATDRIVQAVLTVLEGCR